MKILVADDSKTNLSLLTGSIQKLGHQVITANSGQQAIDLFQTVHPDLVILDVIMEGMDGFECAKKIRAHSMDDWIPIIFLSGSVDDDSIAKGIDAGGDDYLTKPFSEITLAAKIKAMQRISSMRQDLFEATEKLKVNKALYNSQHPEKNSEKNTMPAPSSKNKCTVLNCIVNTTHVCINLHYIKKCVPLSLLQTMPNGPAYLVGLMNLANKSIPVIDLGARLNLKRTTCYSLDTPVLICSDGVNDAGFIVDKISGLFEVDNEELQTQNNIINATSLFLATITINHELSLLIDMQKLVTTDLAKNTLKGGEK